MFGSHFYHATVRKSVAVFGTLFNNIMVARKKGDGSIINQVKVPLAYGPKQKFLSRLDSETGQDASVAMKLPRMSFEITGVEFDTSKKLQKRISINEPTSNTIVTGSSTTKTNILPLFQGNNVTLLTLSSGDNSGEKFISTGFGWGDIDGNPGLNFADKIYILNFMQNSGNTGGFATYNTPPAGATITTFSKPYTIRFFLPNNSLYHPHLNPNLDATKVGFSLGTFNFKVSEAFYVDTDTFIFSQRSTEYRWEMSQAEMDSLFDSLGTSGQTKPLTPISWDNIIETPTTAVTSRNTIKQQAPYNINMQLNIMAKNQDDGLQILEQIVPYFQPEYTVAIKPIDDMTSFKQDVPIILNSVSFDDQYEGDYNSRRVLIYTLDFTMKMSFYGPMSSPGIIRQVLIDFTEERKFGACITLPGIFTYPTNFVAGATVYQGSDKSRTWSGTIDSLESTKLRLVENITTGYTSGAPLFVNNGGSIQRLDAIGNTIALSADLNTLSSMDISIGVNDTESQFDVTTTIDNTDFS